MADGTNSLPAATSNQTYVSVSALQGGFLTLPESLFITNAELGKRATVPSLSFLIQHPTESEDRPHRLVFDLGLKRDLDGYAPAQQHHITQRQPTILSPDVRDSLLVGGLDPAKDIDTVIISHVHWDHVGTSADFSNAQFVVGAGTLHVLANGAGPLYPAEIFNPDEFPRDRTIEFPPAEESTKRVAAEKQTQHEWRPLANFANAIDFFGDGSLYVLDAPGHLLGHVNLLARTASHRWVYLGGDCCHDTRILRGESGIAMYDDGRGGMRSVHMDTPAAKSSLDRIKELTAMAGGEDVEVVIAHDLGWMEANPDRFFPGKL